MTEGIALERLGPLARFVLHAAGDGIAAASAAFGADIDTAMLVAAHRDGCAALRLAPDEWLVLGAPEALAGRADPLAEAAVAHGGSWVEVSARQLTYRISGAERNRLLATGCPVDLQREAARDAACFRTLLGRVEVVLWAAPGGEAWNLEVARSFAPYVERYLDEALSAIAA